MDTLILEHVEKLKDRILGTEIQPNGYFSGSYLLNLGNCESTDASFLIAFRSQFLQETEFELASSDVELKRNTIYIEVIKIPARCFVLKYSGII